MIKRLSDCLTRENQTTRPAASLVALKPFALAIDAASSPKSFQGQEFLHTIASRPSYPGACAHH
jgi:hypothetical protein